MAKSSRASTRKANNQRLKENVFGPVEDARQQRLAAKLLEIASQPKPVPEKEMKDTPEEDASEEKAAHEHKGDSKRTPLNWHPRTWRGIHDASEIPTDVLRLKQQWTSTQQPSLPSRRRARSSSDGARNPTLCFQSLVTGRRSRKGSDLMAVVQSRGRCKSGVMTFWKGSARHEPNKLLPDSNQTSRGSLRWSANRRR